jgi:hypothetical protein
MGDCKGYAVADEMSLPEVKEKLKTYLGPQYQHNDWKTALSIVLKAEDNMTAAIEAVNALAEMALSPSPACSIVSEANFGRKKCGLKNRSLLIIFGPL